jgi:hypothetical protein
VKKIYEQSMYNMDNVDSVDSVPLAHAIVQPIGSDEMTNLLELNKRYMKKFCHSTSKLNHKQLESRYDILLELADVNMVHWENCINQYKRIEQILEQKESLFDELERSYERLNEEEKINKILKRKIKDQDKVIFELQQKSPDVLVVQMKLIMEQLNVNQTTKHQELIVSMNQIHCAIKSIAKEFDEINNET